MENLKTSTFAWNLILAFAAFIAVAYGISALFSRPPMMGFLVFLAPMFAAVAVGQKYADATGEIVPSDLAWKAAFRFALISALIFGATIIGLQAIFFEDFVASAQAQGLDLTSSSLMTAALIAMAVFAVISFLLARLGLWSGSRGGVKRNQRMAAKAAK